MCACGCACACVCVRVRVCVCVCVCVCQNEKKSARRMASTTSDTGDTSSEQQQAKRKENYNKSKRPISLLSLNRLLSNPPSPRLNHGLSLSLPSHPPPSTLHLSIFCLPQITKLHAKNRLQSMQIDVPELQAVSLLSVMTAETIFPDNVMATVIVDV